MARLLRSVSSLRRSLFLDTLESRRGLFETPALYHHFSAANGKEKRTVESSDSGEENASQIELRRSQSHNHTPVISTGSFALDMALGIGGLPKGGVVEIFGPEASGKTTLSLHVIAEAQKKGDYCAFIDADHALDSHLAESIGVKTEKLLLSRPDCGEQALSLVDTLIQSGAVGVIIVDSVAGLIPKGEYDVEMGDTRMALLARLLTQGLRKISNSLSHSQTILIFTNQVRATLNSRFGGASEVTCGGNALKSYASVCLNVRRIGSVKKGDEVIGNVVKAKIVKNKHAPPFREAQFELLFGKGICQKGELIDLAIQHKLMTKHDTYVRMGEVNLDRDAMKKYLVENESIKDELEQKLRNIHLENNQLTETTDNQSFDAA